MKFLNTYGVKVFDPEEAKRVLEKEVSSFSEIMEALAALRREAARNNICLQIEDFDNPDNEGQEIWKWLNAIVSNCFWERALEEYGCVGT